MAASSNICGHFSMKIVCSWNPNLFDNARHCYLWLFSRCSVICIFQSKSSLNYNSNLEVDRQATSFFLLLAIKRLQKKKFSYLFCFLRVENDSLRFPLLFTWEIHCSVTHMFSCSMNPNNFSLTPILTSIPFHQALTCLAPTSFRLLSAPLCHFLVVSTSGVFQ